MMKAILVVANVVRNAEVKSNKDGESFTTFAIAYERAKDDVIYPDVTVNGDGIAEHLTKGRQVTITASDLVPYTYEKKDKTSGTGYKLVNARVYLGDVCLVFARGRLTDDVKTLEGKDFAAPRMLSNVRLGKDKEAVVASSFILGDKYLAACDKSNTKLGKGKAMTVFGEASINTYSGKDGSPGAEIRFLTANVDLGPDAKKREEAPVSVGGDDDGMNEIPD